MPTRRLTAAAATLALLTVLTACTADNPSPASATTSSSSDPTPTPEPTTPTATPEPTPTTTSTPVVRPSAPAALDGPANEANAAAVAEYFVRLFPPMFSDGQTAEWESLSADECSNCLDELAQAKANKEAGKHDVGGAITALDSSALAASDHQWFVDVYYVDEPSSTVDSSGTVVERFPGGNHHLLIVLEWRDGAWTVTDAGNST